MLRRHIRREGLLPARQPRALATRDALLATGRRLLNERDFEAMSIAELASANGLSVGSFYGRFRDKEAYFALLQELVTAEWREQTQRDFEPVSRKAGSTEEIVAWVAAHVVQLFRNDRGFIRASLRHASTHPTAWAPLKRTGNAFAGDVAAILGPRLARLPPAVRTARVLFAMQVLYGVLVNAVLNDPGPLVLADPRLEGELAQLLSGYLAQ